MHDPQIQNPSKRFVNARTGTFSAAGFAAREKAPLPLPTMAGYENVSLVGGWECVGRGAGASQYFLPSWFCRR